MVAVVVSKVASGWLSEGGLTWCGVCGSHGGEAAEVGVADETAIVPTPDGRLVRWCQLMRRPDWSQVVAVVVSKDSTRMT